MKGVNLCVSEDIEHALNLLRSLPCDFEGSKPETLVDKAEHALGLSFPPSYRKFLGELGCGDVNGLEIFGLIDDNFETSSIPNGIWLTLSERKNIKLDPKLIIIADSGDGSYIAIDKRTIDEAQESRLFNCRLTVSGVQS
ncbi:SMI1/KNR4 family protein [Ensifer adhaerens]|uniref:SMI1/KNR4 family protein n=1 Tax=Ensifer adhaerens TaxID=106592 RepID=UPI00098F93A4